MLVYVHILREIYFNDMEAAAENIVSLFVAFYICFDVEIVLYISCYIVINFMLLLHDDATIFEIIICHGIA